MRVQVVRDVVLGLLQVTPGNLTLWRDLDFFVASARRTPSIFLLINLAAGIADLTGPQCQPESYPNIDGYSLGPLLTPHNLSAACTGAYSPLSTYTAPYIRIQLPTQISLPSLAEVQAGTTMLGTAASVLHTPTPHWPSIETCSPELMTRTIDLLAKHGISTSPVLPHVT